jgi:invasion protein IalB
MMFSATVFRAAMAATAIVGLAAGSLPAAAQEAQKKEEAKPAEAKPAEGQPAAGQPQLVKLKGDQNQTDWTKLCGKDPQSQKEVCFTQRSFTTENNQPVMAVAIYATEGGPRFARFILPLGFLLERGMRYTVDKEKPVTGKFQICLPNGCYAEVRVEDGMLKALKGGETMRIDVQNQAAQQISFNLPMAGFSKAFDGPPIDPKVLAEQNKKLEQDLARKVEEQKKLLQQQAAPQQ